MRALRAAAAVVLLAAALAGCAPTVALRAAPAANDPGCADVIVRLPDTVGDLASRQTDAQGTGAWGDGPEVVLSCGVEVPGPSTLRCFLYDDIYWLRDDGADDRTAYTTYGRDPAVRVVVTADAFSSDGIPLDELTSAVSHLPKNGRECVDLDDTVSGQDVD
jgi:hypothetical protein